MTERTNPIMTKDKPGNDGKDKPGNDGNYGITTEYTVLP